MVTLCSSRSWARRADGRGPGPLRSDTCSPGLPSLSETDARKVRVGTSLMRFPASVAEVCLRTPGPPDSWLSRQMQSLRKCSSVQFCYTDFCADKQFWRKRTGLLHAFVDLASCSKNASCCRQCSARQGVCSFSGNRHVQLVGQRQGDFLTNLAEPYPRLLCNRIAPAFHSAVPSRWCSTFWERLS